MNGYAFIKEGERGWKQYEKELNTSISVTFTQMTTHPPNNWQVSLKIPVSKIRKLKLWILNNLLSITGC